MKLCHEPFRDFSWLLGKLKTTAVQIKNYWPQTTDLGTDIHNYQKLSLGCEERSVLSQRHSTQPSTNAALALHERCACAGVALAWRCCEGRRGVRRSRRACVGGWSARRCCEGGRGACRSPYICCLARWTRSQQYWQSVSNFVAMWADIHKVF